MDLQGIAELVQQRCERVIRENPHSEEITPGMRDSILESVTQIIDTHIRTNGVPKLEVIEPDTGSEPSENNLSQVTIDDAIAIRIKVATRLLDSLIEAARPA